jgi:membrane associated rhomboid family serine protease
MLPLHDTRPTRTFPFINYAIILINISIFVYQFLFTDPDAFIQSYGFISEKIMNLDPGVVFRIFSSMWLHGGLLHILSNMWFLHIFGDNVEDRVGHLKYLLFYIASGVVAVMAQYVFNPTSTVPLIGASGAIAGVTGAYFVIFKHSEIVALVPTFFGVWQRVKLPAWFFLGYWFVLQIFSGVGSIVSMDVNQGGIAFFAHIGGFVFGYLISLLFIKPVPPTDDYGVLP